MTKRKRGPWCRLVHELHALGMCDQRIADVLNGEDDNYDPHGEHRPREEVIYRYNHPDTVKPLDPPPDGGFFTADQVRWFRRSEKLPGNKTGRLECGRLCDYHRENAANLAARKGWGDLFARHPWMGLRELQVLELLDAAGPQTKQGLKQGLLQTYGAPPHALDYEGGRRLQRMLDHDILTVKERVKRGRTSVALYALAAGVEKHHASLHPTRVERLHGWSDSAS